mgnify:CR=1 FL=1
MPSVTQKIVYRCTLCYTLNTKDISIFLERQITQSVVSFCFNVRNKRTDYRKREIKECSTTEEIYTAIDKTGFSVNTNPLGMPDSVREALHQAVEEAEHYPDIHAQELANAVAEQLRISEKKLVFGMVRQNCSMPFYTQ